MQVAAISEFSTADGISIQERSSPEPDPTEAVVDVAACSLNRHDLWLLSGDAGYLDQSDLPFVTGLDVAGTVSDVGAAVSSVSPGDRVVLCPNETCGSCRYCREGPENQCEQFSLYHGGLAEQALVQADRLVSLPDAVSLEEAAAIPTAYMTAMHMLEKADVKPGDLVFVPGATGGVGVATVQLASMLGARTIGTSSSTTKLETVRDQGLTHGICETDVEALYDKVTDIGYPDVVINHLGGEYTALGQRVLDRTGTMVICGQTTGPTATLHVSDLFLSHKRIVGSTMGTQHELDRLVTLVADGIITPVIEDRFSLTEAADAFTSLASRSSVGKLLVVP